ncbi:MAG: CHAP domain-containing protein [Thermomicrobiales bacterium]
MFGPQDRITRARAARDARNPEDNGAIQYRLGHGGRFPDYRLPTRDWLCDCSGFACWLVGESREQHGIWLGTDRIYADACGAQAFFRKIPGPTPGCFVVYPASLDPGVDYGHVGLVTEVRADGGITGIDCASTPSRELGRAITERPLDFFTRHGHHLFCVPVSDTLADTQPVPVVGPGGALGTASDAPAEASPSQEALDGACEAPPAESAAT